MSESETRVRFAPSPTGYLHVGGARTALFNWLLARHTGGTFVLRIEDTDQSRHVQDSLPKILQDLRWLGLDWDEGPEKGGDHGPYFQSQRLDLYERYCDRLIDEGLAYFAFDTPEELSAMREQARAAKVNFRYPRPQTLPSRADAERERAAGRPVTVRFKMPDQPLTVVDEILGEVTLQTDQLEDFVIRKNDGFPTYHFACVVDDELMGITHVLRGQEHLMNTPKHVAMQQALGFRTPAYAHLPVIFNMGGGKMSKRDKDKALKKGEIPPEIDVHDFRAAGYLPEALLNFLSLLGWSPPDGQEQLDLLQTVQVFDVHRIGKTNARFDRGKLLAFNTDWAPRLPRERLLAAFKDYLAVTASPMDQADDDTLYEVLEACAGFRTFRDVDTKAGFIFVADEQVAYDDKAVSKVLAKNEGEGYAVLEGLLPQLESLHEWTPAALDELLKRATEQQGVGFGKIAQPIRVAVSGSTISPQITTTLVLLGRQHSCARIRQTLHRRA